MFDNGPMDVGKGWLVLVLRLPYILAALSLFIIYIIKTVPNIMIFSRRLGDIQDRPDHKIANDTEGIYRRVSILDIVLKTSQSCRGPLNP